MRRYIIIAIVIIASVFFGACTSTIDCKMQDGERVCEFHFEGEVQK